MKIAILSRRTSLYSTSRLREAAIERGRRELAFVDWPNGRRAIDVDSGAVRWITRFPAWHAHPDDTGHWIVCDTHPHPRPSPDGKRVLYTSDATGHAQLYECWLES